MKRYNHAYTIAFSLDADEADPYEVGPEDLIDALQKRVNGLRLNREEVLEGVECWDSVDNQENE